MAVITVNVEQVFLVYLVAEDKTHVIKIRLAVVITAVIGQHAQYPVRICRPARKQQRSPVFDDRHFQIYVAGNQTYPCRTGEFFLAGFFSIDIQHRGYPASIFGRYAALVQFGVFYHFGTDGGKESEKVIWIVYGPVIEKYKILVRSSAANIEPGRCFPDCLDSWQCLNSPQQVHFAQNHRYVLYFSRLNRFQPYLGIFYLVHPFGRNSYLVKYFHILNDLYIEIPVAVNHKLPAGRFHNKPAYIQFYTSYRNVYGIITVLVRRTAGVRLLKYYIYPRHRFPRLEIGHPSGKHSFGFFIT